MKHWDQSQRAALATWMLTDALNAVQAIHGDDGLLKVVQHMKMAARSRESNAEIDELERLFNNALGT